MARGTATRVMIRYTGQAGRRIVESYEWNQANGYVQTVTDPALVERLLADGDFVVAAEPDAPATEHQEA